MTEDQSLYNQHAESFKRDLPKAADVWATAYEDMHRSLLPQKATMSIRKSNAMVGGEIELLEVEAGVLKGVRTSKQVGEWLVRFAHNRTLALARHLAISKAKLKSILEEAIP